MIVSEAHKEATNKYINRANTQFAINHFGTTTEGRDSEATPHSSLQTLVRIIIKFSGEATCLYICFICFILSGCATVTEGH